LPSGRLGLEFGRLPEGDGPWHNGSPPSGRLGKLPDNLMQQYVWMIRFGQKVVDAETSERGFMFG